MTTEVLAPLLTPQFFNNNGQPLAAGQLFSYAAGTSTPQSTFTDSTGGTPNANPTILNARGEASIWCPPNVGYKFTLTDSAGNLIWTRDQVIQNQLISLYGGVDTGVVNAYLLSFTGPYAALVNGIVLYWIAANTNTGPSTLSVTINGTNFGIQNIVNQDGSALTAGEITSGTTTTVMYYNGTWTLITSAAQQIKTGSFSGTITGGSNPPLTCPWSLNGQTVNINLPYCAFTSTTVFFTLVGLPANLQPASTKVLPLAIMQDNGANVSTGSAFFGGGLGNVITFMKNGNSGGWTASGVKGLGFLDGPFQIAVTLAYNLQ